MSELYQQLLDFFYWLVMEKTRRKRPPRPGRVVVSFVRFE